MPIYKTANKKDCSNNRGTSLFSATYKILSYILLSRLTPNTEEINGATSVDLDATGQLLIVCSAFIKYFRKNENTMKYCLSYL